MMRQLMERLGEQLKALDRQVGEPGEHVRKRRLELRLTEEQAAERPGVNAGTVLNCMAIDEFYSNLAKQAYIEADVDTVSIVRRLALERIVKGPEPRRVQSHARLELMPRRAAVKPRISRPDCGPAPWRRTWRDRRAPGWHQCCGRPPDSTRARC